jgi:phosphohistidine swiveling domain-containing protein
VSPARRTAKPRKTATQKIVDARVSRLKTEAQDAFLVRTAKTKKERDAAQRRLDAAYEREDKERFKFNEEIRRKVLEQAKGDMMDLHTKDGRKVATVPRAPFIAWALNRTSLKHLAPPWQAVSPPGLKLQMDEPAHTDWFYGATIYVTQEERLRTRFKSAETLDEAKELAQAWGVKLGRYDFDYHGPLDEASHHEAFELQEKLGDFEAPVIVDAGDVQGEVGKEIIVLPDLQPDHVDKIVRAKGIITQVGGKVAHIAQVALERSITIMRVENAVTRFPEGTKLSLYPSDGRIYVWVQRH